MQDRYTGDVGDFGKYGLLRALAGDGELRLGVVWYLVADEAHNEDGRYTEYLLPRHEPLFQPCDPELYDGLRSLIASGRRSVTAVREAGVLPAGTVFHERRLSYEGVPSANRLAERNRWCAGALEATSGCGLVFADPDNGIAGAPMQRGRSDIKHVFIEELAPYLERGQSVVIYHHLGRRGSHEEQIARLADELRTHLELPSPPVSLRYRPWSPRAFFVLPAREHERGLIAQVYALLSGHWSAHFERVSPS